MRVVKKRSRARPRPKTSRPYMPGYGLPKGRKGLLPWKWANERLNKSHNYWIASTRPDGAPHVMVVWGLWLDGALLFSTGRESRKARNLTENPKCVICNELADEAVVVEGIARRVHEPSRLRNFLSLYERKYKWDMSAFEPGILSFKEPVFEVRPGVVFGLCEKKTLNSATRWKFPD
jgi:Pyridoxamine 5'-phosphate oxidase